MDLKKKKNTERMVYEFLFSGPITHNRQKLAERKGGGEVKSTYTDPLHWTGA